MSQSSNSLTARSVLLSVLLGTTPPRLPVRRLVRTTELFGIAEGTTRTALSRMAAAGEVTAGDGWYELAGDRLLARQARQSASREARTAAWEGGRWVEGVVAAEGRRPAAERAALRSALSAARLAELREGVWLRPDNLGGVARLAAGVAAGVGEGGDGVVWFTAVPAGDPAALAARLWPLGSWAEGARRLVGADGRAGRPARGRRPPRRSPTGSCSAPTCCGTCRPTRCCRRSCCPRRGPASASAPTTTGTTPPTEPSSPAGWRRPTERPSGRAEAAPGPGSGAPRRRPLCCLATWGMLGSPRRHID